jgi:hypothetical protein
VSSSSIPRVHNSQFTMPTLFKEGNQLCEHKPALLNVLPDMGLR